MNSIDISKIEQEKEEKLKRYKLDAKSINEFKSNLKKVPKEQGDLLGKELYELISKRGYNENKSLDKVIELIKNGANIEYKEEAKGNYSLLICARKNYIQTFIVLLKSGANVNQINNYLTTATMASARHGNYQMLELLILLGADINSICLDGDTALISSIRHNQTKCFELLVENNANLNALNDQNESIYDLSKEFNGTLPNIKSIPINKDDEITYEDTINLIEGAKKLIKRYTIE